MRGDIEMINSCKCGHWFNTKTKCPECDTVAPESFEENFPSLKNKMFKNKSMEPDSHAGDD